MSKKCLSHRYIPRKNELENEAGHTVMEINLPTGVSPIQEDLTRVRDIHEFTVCSAADLQNLREKM